MELKRFERSRLHHMEHFQFASHVLRLCEEANLPKLNDALPPLVRAINNEVVDDGSDTVGRRCGGKSG